MRTFFPALFILSAFLGGCASLAFTRNDGFVVNEFFKSYKPATIDAKLAPYSGKTEIMYFKTYEGFQAETKEIESRGYTCIGLASFTTTDVATEDQIRSKGGNAGADIVLWTDKFMGSKQISIPTRVDEPGADTQPPGSFEYLRGTFHVEWVDTTVEYHEYSSPFWRKSL